MLRIAQLSKNTARSGSLPNIDCVEASFCGAVEWPGTNKQYDSNSTSHSKELE
jgi:hypothetical protein